MLFVQLLFAQYFITLANGVILDSLDGSQSKGNSLRYDAPSPIVKELR